MHCDFAYTILPRRLCSYEAKFRRENLVKEHAFILQRIKWSRAIGIGMVKVEVDVGNFTSIRSALQRL